MMIQSRVQDQPRRGTGFNELWSEMIEPDLQLLVAPNSGRLSISCHADCAYRLEF